MSTSSADRGRILVVDDDQEVLDLLVELLGQEGYEVCAANDGAEAFDLALSFEPDVVISDVVMPVVDGMKLCRRLKDDSRTANLPVLLISGLRGVVRNVTDQKVAEEALRESEERYRQLVELSPEAIVVHSEGKFTYLNPAAQKLWAASCAEDLI
jgi:CheY-like chemotaxis protein